jgi:hypothetical protein
MNLKNGLAGLVAAAVFLCPGNVSGEDEHIYDSKRRLSNVVEYADSGIVKSVSDLTYEQDSRTPSSVVTKYSDDELETELDLHLDQRKNGWEIKIRTSEGKIGQVICNYNKKPKRWYCRLSKQKDHTDEKVREAAFRIGYDPFVKCVPADSGLRAFQRALILNYESPEKAPEEYKGLFCN